MPYCTTRNIRQLKKGSNKIEYWKDTMLSGNEYIREGLVASKPRKMIRERSHNKPKQIRKEDTFMAEVWILDSSQSPEHRWSRARENAHKLITIKFSRYE